jgi:hypothetical protein
MGLPFLSDGGQWHPKERIIRFSVVSLMALIFWATIIYLFSRLFTSPYVIQTSYQALKQIEAPGMVICGLHLDEAPGCEYQTLGREFLGCNEAILGGYQVKHFQRFYAVRFIFVSMKCFA